MFQHSSAGLSLQFVARSAQAKQNSHLTKLRDVTKAIKLCAPAGVLYLLSPVFSAFNTVG